MRGYHVLDIAELLTPDDGEEPPGTPPVTGREPAAAPCSPRHEMSGPPSGGQPSGGQPPAWHAPARTGPAAGTPVSGARQDAR